MKKAFTIILTVLAYAILAALFIAVLSVIIEFIMWIWGA